MLPRSSLIAAGPTPNFHGGTGRREPPPMLAPMLSPKLFPLEYMRRNLTRRHRVVTRQGGAYSRGHGQQQRLRAPRHQPARRHVLPGGPAARPQEHPDVPQAGPRADGPRQQPGRAAQAARRGAEDAGYPASRSPVASAIFPAAPSRRRSRRVSPAGSAIVITPFGPVILIRPVPVRSTPPPALRTAATSSRAALLRQRSGIYRVVLSCLALARACLPLVFSARMWGAPHCPAPHRISRPPAQRGHLRNVQVNTEPRTSPVPPHLRWRMRGCSRSDAP